MTYIYCFSKINFSHTYGFYCIFILWILLDPRVSIDPLSWRRDIVAIGVLGAVGFALALLAAVIAFWVSKSKNRKLERLERRNSIRQSLHSLRSVGSTSGFSELPYRRKPIAVIIYFFYFTIIYLFNFLVHFVHLLHFLHFIFKFFFIYHLIF